jgi:tRNA(Ile)-lysidine synthase
MASDRNKLKGKAEMKVLRTVRQAIGEHRMLAAGDSVLVAVSGGRDSITLAHVMYTLVGELRLRLAFAHLNHGLRGIDSDRDAEFVADVARQIDVPCYIEKRDVRRHHRSGRMSLEEAGRKVRYEFLEDTAVRHGFNKIAVGHHSNDNAELVLMNLMRGSGPLGLSGMLPVRGAKIIRPLIHLNRSEIVDYIAEKKLNYVTDASNLDLSYRRNRIRHRLIPEIEKSFNPAIVNALNRLGDILRAEDEWIEDLLAEEFDHCISARNSDGVYLDIRRLKGLPVAAKRRVIRKAILTVKKDLRRVTLSHIDAVLALIDKKQVTGTLNLPDGILAILKDAVLKIDKPTNDNPDEPRPGGDPVLNDYRYLVSAPVDLLIEEAGVTLKLTEIGIDELTDLDHAGRQTAYFDRDRIQTPLIVRNARPGDRFAPLGVDGTQKVKKYFIDHKIPVHQRRRCPLLLSGTDIIWVAGHRIGNCAKVVSTTRRILKAELLLA